MEPQFADDEDESDDIDAPEPQPAQKRAKTVLRAWGYIDATSEERARFEALHEIIQPCRQALSEGLRLEPMGQAGYVA